MYYNNLVKHDVTHTIETSGFFVFFRPRQLSPEMLKIVDEQFKNRRDEMVVGASASQLVDLGFIPEVESYQKTLKNGIYSLLGAQHKKRIVWKTSRQACLLCPRARHLMRRLHLNVADRWPTRTSSGYNCEVANPACRKKRLLVTHQW